MSNITEISDTVCVNLNDAIVWIAFRIFPMTYFEPLDANTAELLKIIDCGNWVSNNNMCALRDFNKTFNHRLKLTNKRQ